MYKKVHLICNAHLDPVWLWPWEDGLAEALSTFRVAADFCDKHPTFVFNHNEAVLYRWVETHDPALFARIKKLVLIGKWHIAGGSFVQPDINTPCGESHIRQFLHGVRYFQEKFGVRPTTAYNFDPFGQPEGYPQILYGCGFDSYIFCRPDFGTVDIPTGAFTWKDRSGSSVIARRGDDHYLSNGQIRSKLDKWLEHYKSEPEIMILWGIGNHGGGVSRTEYAELCTWAQEHPEYDLVHSTPESFFKSVKNRNSLPVVTGEMQQNFPGCYTSFSRLKRAHRAAEYLALSIERLCALAWWAGRIKYPHEELNTAWRDILFCQFHDVLPGSSVQSTERDSLDCLAHATEILRRIRMKVLTHCLQSILHAHDGTVPLIIYNPHGVAMRSLVECEYMMTSIAIDRGCAELLITDEHGGPIRFQHEKEESNLVSDWRVKVAIDVELKPFELKQLNATFIKRQKPLPWIAPALPDNGIIHHKAGDFEMSINTSTGLVDCIRHSTNDCSITALDALCPVVFADLDNSWVCGNPDCTEGHNTATWITTGNPWPDPIGRFRLTTPQEAFAIVSSPKRRFSITQRELQPVNIIEDGAVRTIVEAIFVWQSSVIIRHYILGKSPALFEIHDRILWTEKDCMLKIEVPTAHIIEGVHAESPYSAIYRTCTEKHADHPNQTWISLICKGPQKQYLAIVNNGSFAHSTTQKALYLNVLRSPAYSSGGLSATMEQHTSRFLPRQEQGEHLVQFGCIPQASHDESAIAHAASVFNMRPYTSPFYSGGQVDNPKDCSILPDLQLSPENVYITTAKCSEDGASLIVRLYETGGKKTQAHITIDNVAFECDVAANAIQTIRITRTANGIEFELTDLLENVG